MQCRCRPRAHCGRAAVPARDSGSGYPRPLGEPDAIEPNEIRERARSFAREWAGETSERAEAQSFWNGFFDVFGVNRHRVAVFEQKAQRFSGSRHGRIDVFWPGVMLAEY